MDFNEHRWKHFSSIRARRDSASNPTVSMAEPSKHDWERTSTERGMQTTFNEHSAKQNSGNPVILDSASNVNAPIVAL
jgi:hypothetical protein